MENGTPPEVITLRTMIAHLEALLEEHGDVPVWIDDADTGWALGIDLIEYRPGAERPNIAEGVYISSGGYD